MANIAQNLDEAMLVGSALIGEEKIPPDAFEVEPRFFEDADFARAWSAILDATQRANPPDIVDVWLTMGDKQVPQWFFEAMDCVPTVANFDIGCRRFREVGLDRCRKRDVERITREYGDQPELMQSELNRVLGEHSKRDGEGLTHIRQVLKKTMADLDAQKVDPDRGIVAWTGFQTLDRKARLLAGGMTVLAARPGMGKSAIANIVARNCARKTGTAVAMFSMEMTSSVVGRRLLASESGIRDPRTDHEFYQSAEACNVLHNLPIWVDDRAGLSVSDIRAALGKLLEISLLVVDYLQLSKPEGKFDRHDLAIGSLTKGIRALAKERGCHALVLSQLNRAVEKRDNRVPQLSDLRDSGNIEEDADNIWFLYRPAYYGREGASDNDAEIIIAKNRNGPTGTVKLSFDGETGRFSEP